LALCPARRHRPSRVRPRLGAEADRMALRPLALDGARPARRRTAGGGRLLAASARPRSAAEGALTVPDLLEALAIQTGPAPRAAPSASPGSWRSLLPGRRPTRWRPRPGPPIAPRRSSWRTAPATR